MPIVDCCQSIYSDMNSTGDAPGTREAADYAPNKATVEVKFSVSYCIMVCEYIDTLYN
jgi:hypothetical protein